MRKRNLPKLIFGDCARAMCPAMITYILKDTVLAQITIIIADVLGQFADAIFKSNASLSEENLLKIVACLFASIFLIPIIDIIGEKFMFSNALKHDRIVLNRFLDKKFDSTLSFDEGSAQYRLENDPNEFRKQWIDLTNKCVITPIILAVLLFAAFRISFLFTIITACVSIMKLAMPILVKKMEAKYDLMSREYDTQLRTYQTEFSTKPHAISMLGLKNGLLNRIDLLFNNYHNNTFVKRNNLMAFAGFIGETTNITSLLIIFVSGAIMVANHSISSGAILSMMTYLSVFDMIFGNIGSIIRGIPIIKNVYDRVSELYSNPESSQGLVIHSINNIKAQEISYCFEDRIIISNVSFCINKGDKIAVCGKNGSGKTTLINILSSLLLDYCGDIDIDGVPLRNISIEAYRKRVAIARQEPFLFSGTVKENIAIAGNDSKISTEEIINKVGIANIAERFVSTKENDLSGGEKQKISIARCLVRDCDVILLDEPTNNLDENSLEWLYNFILMTNKTIVYISHDDRFSKIADKIITL